MEKARIAMISVWFGKEPPYFKAWLKSLEHLKEQYQFWLITDLKINHSLPENLKVTPMTLSEFKSLADSKLGLKTNLKRGYRVCDFRPMFGLLFKKELEDYDFWGHTDLDTVYGDITKFVTEKMLAEHDIIFNGGHFTLYKNNETINGLYKARGSIFTWQEVVTKDAVFAFDETTGMQMIARKNNIKSHYGLKMVDVDPRHKQLRNCMEAANPDYQAFYYEDGKIYRAMIKDKLTIEELAYIHIPIKKLSVLKPIDDCDSFWITPDGFLPKKNRDIPDEFAIKKYNPFPGSDSIGKENDRYNRKKIAEILRKPPYQIYVKIKQHVYGISAAIGKSK